MRVDPAADEKVVAVAEVEECVVAFFGRVAGVGGADLVGNDEVVDEEGVGDESSAEDAASFKVAEGVWMREIEEGCPQLGREQHCAEGCARFCKGVWLEGILCWWR